MGKEKLLVGVVWLHVHTNLNTLNQIIKRFVLIFVLIIKIKELFFLIFNTQSFKIIFNVKDVSKIKEIIGKRKFFENLWRLINLNDKEISYIIENSNEGKIIIL